MCTEEVAAESTTRRPKHCRQCLQSLVLLGHRGHAGVGFLDQTNKQTSKTKFIHYIKKLRNMNLGSCQMRSARSDIAASSTTPLASTLPSPPRPRPRAPTPAWPRWPRRTRLWRRWRRCFGRLVVDSAATSSVHIRSPCCTTVSCLFRNFRQHFLKRGYFAILDFQPYYNIACILYTVELYTLHNY